MCFIFVVLDEIKRSEVLRVRLEAMKSMKMIDLDAKNVFKLIQNVFGNIFENVFDGDVQTSLPLV